MEVLDAQEIIKDMKIICTPYMKKDAYEKFHNSVMKRAYPKNYDGPPVGPQDLAKILGAGRARTDV